MTTTVDKTTNKDKVKVLVNLDTEALNMVDMMRTVHEFDSRSSYLRKLVKADYRRWQRKIQKAQAQS